MTGLAPMTALIAKSAGAAIALLAITIGAQLFVARRRRERLSQMELVPNVLLTRFPVTFVGQARSVFRLGGDFQDIPVYLREHGFAVEEIELSREDQSRHDQSLLNILDDSTGPRHLIVSPRLSSVALDSALNGHPKLATLSIFGGSRAEANEPLTAKSLRPYRLPVFERPDLAPNWLSTSLKTEAKALEHAVSLAEYDLR